MWVSSSQVYEDVSQCCQALSQRLGTQPYFFNKQYVFCTYSIRELLNSSVHIQTCNITQLLHGIFANCCTFKCHRPTELDALVFGHLFTILTTQLTSDELAEKVKSYTNLLSFCHRIEQTYFKEHDREGQSVSSRHSKSSLP